MLSGSSLWLPGSITYTDKSFTFSRSDLSPAAAPTASRQWVASSGLWT